MSTIVTGQAAAAPRRLRWRPGRIARRFGRNRVAVTSTVVFGILVLIALVSLVWTPQDPAKQDLLGRLSGPSGDHWLGTDAVGRDLCSRLMVATRVALVSSLQAVGLAFVVGVPLGLVAGYFGGILDAVLSRIADVLLALPPLLFAIAIVGVLGRGLTNAMIAIGVLLAPRFFRLTRAATKDSRDEIFVEAARASGSSTSRILLRHVLPSVSSPLLVQISFGAAVAIVAESGLSFLGLGAQSPTASWGSMLKDGFDNLATSKWPIFPPSIAMVVTILVLSLVGDGLRDAVGRQTEGGR